MQERVVAALSNSRAQRGKDLCAPSLMWFRRDLRLSDNPALEAALASGFPLVLLYLYEADPGEASCWWLHHSLAALTASIEKMGSDLILQKGTKKDLKKLIVKHKIQDVYWNDCLDPQDPLFIQDLENSGCRAHVFFGNSLIGYDVPMSGKGTPYKVFSPYERAFCKQEIPKPIPTRIKALPPVACSIPSVSLKSLHLLPKIDWAAEFPIIWSPGEEGAKAKLAHFLKIEGSYKKWRDFPAQDATSRLSPHLHFGEISTRTVWHAVHSSAYRRQLIWREFAAAIFYHRLEAKPMPVAWLKDHKSLQAWQKGLTGYPLVDAGMRELWRTGWMHNRVRMVVASFLTKHLLINWKEGEEWFRNTLLDADESNNLFGWQWVAGCGFDPSPYHRIFHPVLQSRRFDPEGDYIRKYVPELAALPNRWIHAPWEAPESVLKETHICLGKDYPHPIVDHAFARKRALEALL